MKHWVKVFEDRATFFDECAAIAFDPPERQYFETMARRRRWDATLVRFGVPGALLNLDFRPKPKYDKKLLAALTPPLTAFATGALGLVEVKDFILTFFDMPMPVRDARRIRDYLDCELAPLPNNPSDVRLAANGISGMIECERHDYAYRVANGWPEKPCPWGGDEPGNSVTTIVLIE